MFLVDANVLIDIGGRDETWSLWSSAALLDAASRGPTYINLIVYAELASDYPSKSKLDEALAELGVATLAIPHAAAFAAGMAYRRYRSVGGTRLRVLPDFLIGAHAAEAGLTLLTRDPRPYRTYFPTVELIAPA